MTRCCDLRKFESELWLQEDPSMTAVNGTIDGMPNTRESAILAAATEAVEWKHPIEPVRRPLTSYQSGVKFMSPGKFGPICHFTQFGATSI
jgi:hypothetical protein